LIAGFSPEHPFHGTVEAPLRAARKKGRLIAHTMAETYSVLTGQAYGHPPANVLGFLEQFLQRPAIGLAATSYFKVLREMAGGEIRGGAIYDGLIAAAAAQAGVRLLSLDRRAVRTYAMLDADHEILI
jgi:toxin FitB